MLVHGWSDDVHCWDWLLHHSMVALSIRSLTHEAARPRLRNDVALLLLLTRVLGTFAAVRRLAAHTPVLVMARQVQAGATIGAADVRVAELGLAPGVATLPPEARDRVVGHLAVGPLAAGQVRSAGPASAALAG